MRVDICVVGGGLAGGIIASELSKDGCNVALIEQASNPSPLAPDDEDWVGEQPQTSFTRGEGPGGSSNYWHGALVSLDPTDVEAPASDGGGARLPIAYDDLSEYYRHSLRTLTGDALSLSDLQNQGASTPAFRCDAEHFILKPHFVPKRPLSTKTLIDEAVSRHRLTLFPFKAEEIEFASDGRATAVVGRQDGSRQRHRVEAEQFVVCAGGYGSPKLLLKSAKPDNPLSSLPIGRNLIDHPSGFAFKAKLKDATQLEDLFGGRVEGHPNWRRRLGFRLRGEHLGLSEGRNHALYLRPAFGLRDPVDYYDLKTKLVRYRGRKVSLVEKMQLLRYPDLFLESIASRYALHPPVRYVSGFVVAEQHPDARQRIELGERGRFDVHWGVSDDDERSIRRFISLFLDSHAHTFSDYRMSTGRLDSGGHHSGTCRMAALPSDGVVDDDFRVFGTRNLFVADGSVIGYTGHANTGLTIAALAHRCCDVLRGKAMRRTLHERPPHARYETAAALEARRSDA